MQRAGPARGAGVHVQAQLHHQLDRLEVAAAGGEQHPARAVVGTRRGVGPEAEEGPQHLHVAGLGRGEKGREPAGAPRRRRGPVVRPPGAGVQVGPAGDERPDHLEVALPHRRVQGRAAGAVPHVDVGPLVQHQPGHGVAAGGDREQERGAAVGGGDVGVGSGRDQGKCARGVPVLGREQKGTEAVAGDRVDVGAPLDEERGDGRMPAGDGPHQRRLSHARLRCVDVGLPVEQQPHQLLVAAVNRGEQRRVPAPAGGAHVGAGVEEPAGEGEVAVGAGEQQRRLPVLVHRVGFGPSLQQGGGDVGVAAERGPRQRRRSVGADRVDVRAVRDQRLHGCKVEPLHGVEEPFGRRRRLCGGRWRPRQRENDQPGARAMLEHAGHDRQW